MFAIFFVATFIYFVLAFIAFVGERLTVYKSVQSTTLPKLFDAVDTIIDKPIYQSVGSAAVDYSQFNCDELRSLCTEKGIKWRNVHGRNKHLKKAEMVAALS